MSPVIPANDVSKNCFAKEFCVVTFCPLAISVGKNHKSKDAAKPFCHQTAFESLVSVNYPVFMLQMNSVISFTGHSIAFLQICSFLDHPAVDLFLVFFALSYALPLSFAKEQLTAH